MNGIIPCWLDDKNVGITNLKRGIVSKCGKSEILLRCLGWDQTPHWGKKEKNEVK